MVPEKAWEKRETVLKSAQAPDASMLMLNRWPLTLAFKRIFPVLMAMMSKAASRATAPSADRQAKLIEDAMSEPVMEMSKTPGPTVSLVRKVIRPGNKRVMANVRPARQTLEVVAVKEIGEAGSAGRSQAESIPAPLFLNGKLRSF